MSLLSQAFMLGPAEIASKKITDAKFAKKFQVVLKELQKAQRLAAEKDTSHSPFIPQVVLHSRYIFYVQH
uniref:Uncharacterized protein n=1 Tax=Solanum lycopersicum TaxID=4081 RepID=A0A3Q7HMS3_SOLLC